MIDKLSKIVLKALLLPGEKLGLIKKFGRTDSFLHFEVSLILSMILGIIFKGIPFWPLLITMIVGIIKEIYDTKKTNPTGFSMRDLFWDGVGAFLGSFIILLIFLIFG